MNNLLTYIVMGLFIVVMVSIGPWCMIWAINTLVHAGGITTFTIPFNVWTWLAALLLGGISAATNRRQSS